MTCSACLITPTKGLCNRRIGFYQENLLENFCLKPEEKTIRLEEASKKNLERLFFLAPEFGCAHGKKIAYWKFVWRNFYDTGQHTQTSISRDVLLRFESEDCLVFVQSAAADVLLFSECDTEMAQAIVSDLAKETETTIEETVIEEIDKSGVSEILEEVD